MNNFEPWELAIKQEAEQWAKDYKFEDGDSLNQRDEVAYAIKLQAHELHEKVLDAQEEWLKAHPDVSIKIYKWVLPVFPAGTVDEGTKKWWATLDSPPVIGPNDEILTAFVLGRGIIWGAAGTLQLKQKREEA